MNRSTFILILLTIVAVAAIFSAAAVVITFLRLVFASKDCFLILIFTMILFVIGSLIIAGIKDSRN